MYDFKTTLLSISLFSFLILIFIKITKKKLYFWGKNKMLEEEKREWYCELSVKMIMSWGYATVNIQRKIR
jgi:hypothetical protein